jgi:twinkle protein
MDDRTAHWIEDRGISVEIAAEHGLTSLNGHPAFRFTDLSGELLYHKVRLERNGTKTFRRDRKGVRSVLFNLEALSEELPHEDTPLIVCEGEVDCLSWIEAGATHVVSVPDGAQRSERGEGGVNPLQDTGFSWLWGEDGMLLPELTKFRKVIIATDDDAPGEVLAEDLAIRLGRARCWHLPDGYGKDCKDANDALRKYGIDHLHNLLNDARPMYVSRNVGLAEVKTEGTRTFFEVGWGVLRDNIKIACPEFMVVTGEPGAGKSQWTFNLMLEMARLHRINGFILQFEDHPARLQADAIEYAKQWSARNQPNHPNCGDDPEEWINTRIRTVEPPGLGEKTPDQTLDWIKDQIEVAVYQHGCKLVILDPWNEIEHAWGAKETETQYTNRAIKDLKDWARGLRICLIIVTHPGKQIQSKDIDDIGMYDIAGSAAWFNKADHGVILKRVPDPERPDNPTNMVYVKVCKSKDQMLMGVPGMGVLEFDRRRRIYT